MRSVFAIAVTATTLSMALALPVQAERTTDHAHMDRVHMDHGAKDGAPAGQADTPNGQGYLATAIAEAKTAAEFAARVMQKPEDLEWLQMQTRNTLHAIDPTVVAMGPGLGYGVVRAANAMIDHVNAAAKADGALPTATAHAVHVNVTMKNTLYRTKAIIENGQDILAAESAAEAAPLAAKIAALTAALLNGHDANGDGKITWHPGEGGLVESGKHMGFVVKDEGY